MRFALVVPHLFLAAPDARDYVRGMPLDTPDGRVRSLRAQVYLQVDDNVSTLVASDGSIFFVKQHDMTLFLHSVNLARDASRIQAFRNLVRWCEASLPGLALSAEVLGENDRISLSFAQLDP